MNPQHTAAGTLVLDFDGTVCLGDDPVRLYAQEATAELPDEEAARILTSLEAFLAGDEVHDAADGYQAVQRMATAAGVEGEALNAAYRRSRARFAAGEGHTWAPEGLGETITTLQEHGNRVVLVTNAPRDGVADFLQREGLLDLLDEIVPEAGKPAGMAAALQRLIDVGGHEPHRLLSVGDVWINDIGPAIELGCATAFIDRFGLAEGGQGSEHEVAAPESPLSADLIRSQIGNMFPAFVLWGCHVDSWATDS